MAKIYILIFAIIFSAISLNAQKNKTIKLKDIKGTAIGGIISSPAQVINDALKNAKLNALMKAGIHEHINIYQNLFKSETPGEYEEVFTSNVFTNIKGVVTSVSITDTIASFDPKSYTLKAEVTIDAKVLKYDKEEDRTFDAWTEGIKSFYNNNEALSLKIKPTKECYVRMFLIARQQESYILFPNKYENDFKLTANSQQIFPSTEIEYIMNTKITQEPHRLIIVLLKEPIPYTGKVAYKPILDWIFNISPDQRVVKSIGFSVIKN
ncbi:MAG: hypothetical protein C0599_14040 [Salinivirgaceae bacterium]|nr:MAG: hypothetical protein C0599_14040 [Salinivirgaceae bacterium]